MSLVYSNSLANTLASNIKEGSLKFLSLLNWIKPCKIEVTRTRYCSDGVSMNG